MDEFPDGMLTLTDRIRDDCIVPVTMPGFFGAVENAGEHPPVGQSNAHGSAEKGFNLLIGHASGNRLRVARGCAQPATSAPLRSPETQSDPRENIRNGG